MIHWFSTLSIQVQAAAIGALASILVGIGRDFGAKWWVDRREARKSAEDVYRRYAEPLSLALTSLFWRLRETFGGDGRAYYLLAQEPRNPFEDYKLRSTYYRLAAVLGWVRALRRELSFFRLEGRRRLSTVEDAIANLEASLADGHHVELQRLDGLFRIWHLPRLTSGSQRLALAVDVEICASRFLQRARAASPSYLSIAQQAELCGEIAQLVCSRAQLAPVSKDVLEETRSDVVRQIGIRQAWLYRDWQAAAGDLMIHETTVGNRRFEVIGFGDFESMIMAPTEAQFRVLCRIANLFDQVDVDRKDPFDARPAALRNLFQATANMVKIISQFSPSEALIDAKTSESAARVLQKPASDD